MAFEVVADCRQHACSILDEALQALLHAIEGFGGLADVVRSRLPATARPIRRGREPPPRRRDGASAWRCCGRRRCAISDRIDRRDARARPPSATSRCEFGIGLAIGRVEPGAADSSRTGDPHAVGFVEIEELRGPRERPGVRRKRRPRSDAPSRRRRRRCCPTGRTGCDACRSSRRWPSGSTATAWAAAGRARSTPRAARPCCRRVRRARPRSGCTPCCWHSGCRLSSVDGVVSSNWASDAVRRGTRSWRPA